MECESPLKRPRRMIGGYEGHINGIPLNNPLRQEYFHNQQFQQRDYEEGIEQIISDLYQAFSIKQRVHVLHQLLHSLEYDFNRRLCRCQPRFFSCCLQFGIIPLLCLQLSHALGRYSGNGFDDINLMMVCLDIFYRYCPSELVTEESIRKQGMEIVQLSFNVYERSTYITTNTNNHSSNPSVGLSIVSIWHSCSSCSLGTSILFQQPLTLDITVKVLQQALNQQGKSKDALIHYQSMEITMECLGLLKNLTYFGEDHRHRIADKPTLLGVLTSLTDITDDKGRERLSAVFRNLALSMDIRFRLAQSANVLNVLIRIASICSNSPRSSHFQGSNVTENTINIKNNTLRNVLSTLTSLAMDVNSAHLMIIHGEGIILDQLKRFLVYENDAIVRKRSARALRILARDGSSQILGSSAMFFSQDNHLLQTLSHQALHDTNEAARNEAAEAFARCAGLVRVSMPQHEAVLNTLTQLAFKMEHSAFSGEGLSGSPTSGCISSEFIARAFQEQASHVENRTVMAHHEKLIQALAHLLMSPKSTVNAKDSIANTILDLSKDENNRQSLAVPCILDALVKSLMIDPTSTVDDENISRTRIRETIIQTILSLSKTHSTWNVMANHTSMLQSLLKFAATTSTNQNLKKETKKVILHLAAQL